MFDLEGTYTLVEIFPPLPINIPGCSYNVGDYGIIIDSINAFVGRAQYTLPMGSSEIHLDYFKETDPKFYKYVISQGYTETCLDLGDTQNINLYGTLLIIPLYENYKMVRQVELLSDKIILKWIDETINQLCYWTFEKNIRYGID